jgi:hypothetical protein
MVGIFHEGDTVSRNVGMAVQDNNSSGGVDGANVGKVTRVYGDENNPLCDVAYGDGSMATGIPMRDLNGG